MTAARAAAADPGEPRVRLVWERGPGAESCPDREAVAREVTARLGRDPFAGGAEARRTIVARVDRDGDGWRVEIRERSAAGAGGEARTLPSRSKQCGSILTASALVVALLIEEPAPPPTPRRRRPVLAITPPDPPLPTTFTPRAVLALGLVPGVAPGLALVADFGHGTVTGTGGVLWLPREAASDPDFAVGLSAAFLGACVWPHESRLLSLGGCGSLYAGAVRGGLTALSGSRYHAKTGGDVVWIAAGIEPRARLRLGPWLTAEAGLDVLALPTRYDLDYTRLAAGSTVLVHVFTQEVLAGAAFVGLGVTIP